MEADKARALHDELLGNKPDAARHNADVCPFCVEKAQAEQPRSGTLPPSGGPDESENDKSQNKTKGGTTTTMTDMSSETHEALVRQAVEQATAATDQALATKVDELASVTGERNTLKERVETLEADNARLNRELDAAQVEKTSAVERADKAEADLAAERDTAAKTATKAKRVEQVKGLGYFDQKHIDDKAEAWSELDDTAWAERLADWSALKGPDAGDGTKTSSGDTASAMTGSSGSLTEGESDTASETKKTPARRAVLGLSGTGGKQ